jgi:2,3-bisphosphoglycerate-dependent phosphoglycerate mutase
MTRIALVRHCESAGQAPEAPLTETGHAQALDLVGRLSSLAIDHIVCSPYARARATIQPFAMRAGLPVHLDDRLAERRLSPEPIDNWRGFVRQSFDDPDSRAPGGESGRETLGRAWAAMESVLQGGHRLPVVVSHGQLLSLVLHSIDPGFGYAGWEALQNPDVYLLEGEPGPAFTFRRI